MTAKEIGILSIVGNAESKAPEGLNVALEGLNSV